MILWKLELIFFRIDKPLWNFIMDNKRSIDQSIDQLVKAEWDMFQLVQNTGGKASCQEDFTTFEIMRSCQFKSWSDAALESYLADLENARQGGKNLITEKYARMMESTSPKEYRKIKRRLPPVHPDVYELIGKILKILLACEEELIKKYPNLTKRGRVLYSTEDTPFATSKETYFKGELATYSLKTLRLYYEHISDLESRGENVSEVVLKETVTRYGYGSLQEAEDSY